MTTFINPKTDFAFKKIFGSTQTKDILISFLNALLYNGQEKIEDLEILDPYLPPSIEGGKDSYLDIKARLQEGTTVLIEMQVLNVEGFEKRIAYNLAKAYSSQLQKGQVYIDINPAIALTITDFVMFPQFEKVISRFYLKEEELDIDFLKNHLELIFVELPKFNKDLDDLESLTDKWIYFMKYARTLQTVPEIMQRVPELQHAFEIANQANLTTEELKKLDEQETVIRDFQGAMSLAIKEGLQQGIEQGLQQGIEQGLQQGIEQGIEQGLQQGIEQGLQQGIEQGKEAGIRQEKESVARKLLGRMGEEEIAQISGLTLQEIEQLKAETNRASD